MELSHPIELGGKNCTARKVLFIFFCISGHTVTQVMLLQAAHAGVRCSVLTALQLKGTSVPKILKHHSKLMFSLAGSKSQKGRWRSLWPDPPRQTGIQRHDTCAYTSSLLCATASLPQPSFKSRTKPISKLQLLRSCLPHKAMHFLNTALHQIHCSQL